MQKDKNSCFSSTADIASSFSLSPALCGSAPALSDMFFS
jgi:hypothetical protein